MNSDEAWLYQIISYYQFIFENWLHFSLFGLHCHRQLGKLCLQVIASSKRTLASEDWLVFGGSWRIVFYMHRSPAVVDTYKIPSSFVSLFNRSPRWWNVFLDSQAPVFMCWIKYDHIFKGFWHLIFFVQLQELDESSLLEVDTVLRAQLDSGWAGQDQIGLCGWCSWGSISDLGSLMHPNPFYVQETLYSSTFCDDTHGYPALSTSYRRQKLRVPSCRKQCRVSRRHSPRSRHNLTGLGMELILNIS